MSGQPPNSLRQDEQNEYPFVGPFGGIQSEVGLSQIGNKGFAEVQNIIFRRSHARTVPGFTPVTQPRSGGDIASLVGQIGALAGIIANLSSLASSEPILGIADFFNVDGTRIPVVWTPTRMYSYAGGVPTQIVGTLTGTAAQFFQAAVVGYKLYFSQQKDVVQVWDGITNSFAAASGSAVPAKYLMELGFHLLAGNCIVGGMTAPNRIFWTGAGDGTDWTSYDSGQEDLFNNLGPINGLCRLFQSGFAMQQWGVTQIVPTGIGLSPFQFIPLGAYAKGCILPYSLASFGELIACYVGKDDVYVFDGTEAQGIGSRPIDGNRRLGARVRIFQDLFTALQSNIFGYIMTSANGFEYESYWLFIPSLNKAWVYHFDEGSWTQVYFKPGQLVGPVGTYPTQSAPRIKDLIGTIAQQSWTPATLGNVDELDTMAISDGLADSFSYFNFSEPPTSPTSNSIFPGDGWYIRSGQLTFDDSRHQHTVKRFRLLIEDYAPNMQFNVRFTNDKGYSPKVQTFVIGTGSGDSITKVIETSINGRFITWELSGPPGISTAIIEMTPIYDVGGEVRGGS